MDTVRISSQCKTRQCSQCQGDSEFYCRTCQYDLCLQCKEIHVIVLGSPQHNVVIYREKFKSVFKQETCARHPDMVYEIFCRPCNVPVCMQCSDHSGHKTMDLKTVYEALRQQHRTVIHRIRDESLYNCHILLTGIETDLNTCHANISQIEKKMSIKSRRIKLQMNFIFKNVTTFDVYENVSEPSAKTLVELILLLKKACLSKLLCISLSSLTKDIQKENVMESLTKVQVTERGKRVVRTESLLKELPTVFPVRDISYVAHISLVSTDELWVSDFFARLILADTTGTTLNRLTDTDPRIIYGFHTTSSAGELFYIDSELNIGKLSTADNAKSILIKNEQPWIPNCVVCSPSTGDLLVGMKKVDHSQKQAKIKRYKSTGRHVQTVETNQAGDRIYSFPIYITENKDKHVIVADWDRGVVVTDLGGNHLFTYTGPPAGVRLDPRGICVDAISHILVCDFNTDSIQMIDRNGQFLSWFLTKQHGIYGPFGLCYDSKHHRLWVGSGYSNAMHVYKYIPRRQT